MAKKRGQPVKAQVAMVRLAMTFIEKIEAEEAKMTYIKTMKDVCEKKIYLEVSHLGLTAANLPSNTLHILTQI